MPHLLFCCFRCHCWRIACSIELMPSPEWSPNNDSLWRRWRFRESAARLRPMKRKAPRTVGCGIKSSRRFGLSCVAVCVCECAMLTRMLFSAVWECVNRAGCRLKDLRAQFAAVIRVRDILRALCGGRMGVTRYRVECVLENNNLTVLTCSERCASTDVAWKQWWACHYQQRQR